MTNSADIINKLIADADAATGVLNAARRETFSDYMERVRKLRDLKTRLHMVRTQPSGDLFDVSVHVAPELQQLLIDPLHGL